MSPRRTQRPQVPAERRARRIAVAVGVAVVVGTAAVIALIRPHDVQSTPPSTSLPPVTTPGVGPSGLTGNPEIPMVKSIVDYLARWLEGPKEAHVP